MKQALRILSIAMIGGVTACATPSAPAPQVETQAEVNIAPTPAPVSGPQSLPPQTLSVNECGLFLWSKTDSASFVFFSKAGTREALFLRNGKQVLLREASNAGDIFGQFYTGATYQADGEPKPISLNYTPGEDIPNGARVPSGVITYFDQRDWKVTLPVLGVRYCQPLTGTDERSPVLPSDLQR